MQCMLYKIYFWKVFHMYYNLICIFICTPICTIFFILVKIGCYILGTKNHTKFYPDLDPSFEVIALRPAVSY
jgi:hypothetical protein